MMKSSARYIILIILLVSTLISRAQYNPDKFCRFENGRMIFTFNLKWSDKEIGEISEQFDLDSSLIKQVFSGKLEIVVANEKWTVRRINTEMVELSKPLQSKTNKNMQVNDLFLMVDQWMNFKGETTFTTETYGINNFDFPPAFEYNNNKAKFYLPGNNSASKVYISGSFNNWSTTQNPMKNFGSGWIVDLNLKPGKYSYKYIVDGRWITDPSNKIRERNNDGGYNSVVYCYSHLFELNGYKDAHRVVVTGNFFKWNQRGLPMNRTTNGWSLPIYFREGTYSYKFLVDGQWMTDPANKSTKEDRDGNLNSFIGIGEPYLFKLTGFTTAEKVILTGSFNGWSQNELVMDKTDIGWQLPYFIPVGNYEYKFIVDWKWITDPLNPFSTGSGDTENSFISLKANHIFELSKYPDARKVVVTGSFNRWKTQDYRMIKEKGKWIFPLYLQPGKYTYKFIVDDTWILDPNNQLYEQNEHGTYNSVLWIDTQP